VMRFAREVRCLGQLEHPGIVPVHDVGLAEDGSYFLVMKHLEGETLEALIQRLRAGNADSHAAFPMQERVRICEAVLRIIEYAHDRGVIHRDIKPSNIMIGRHGEVTVVDWGLAKQINIGDAAPSDGLADALENRTDSLSSDQTVDSRTSRTQTGTTLGTPLSMSPEQASGSFDVLGSASDLYSMGVVFYELLSLEHYIGTPNDITTTLDSVIGHDARLAYWVISPHQQRVPIELAYWLQKAMRKAPQDRFDSAMEMRNELQRAIGGHFDVVCPTTFSRRVFRCGMDSANKRPLLTLLAMAAGTAFCGYGAWRMLMDWL